MDRLSGRHDAHEQVQGATDPGDALPRWADGEFKLLLHVARLDALDDSCLSLSF
jgi:hypothetical protein